jgi:trehalose synthase-fused probable maltokinase
VIADYVKARRWFRAKARPLTWAGVDEAFPLLLGGEEVSFAIIRCAYADGGQADHYVLPLATARGEEAERLGREQPHLVVGPADGGGVQYDALGSPRLLAALLGVFEAGGARAAGRQTESERGTLVFRTAAGYGRAKTSNVAPRPTKTEQTNTSIVFGDSFILKIVRKLDEGRSAELEMGEFLTRHGYTSAPEVVGAIEIERPGAKEPATVGILHRFVANEGDAWTSTLADLEASPEAATYLPRARRLGARVGEMHVVLAGGSEPAFTPERLDIAAREGLAARVGDAARAASQWLAPSDVARVVERAKDFAMLTDAPLAMRVHGDLHLGQILVRDDEFVIIDFEGEPARPLAERKAKRSPLADVAGMVRSFDYAASSVIRKKHGPAVARAWSQAVSTAFVAAWRAATVEYAALAMPDDVFTKTLAVHLLEKCLYEIAYEANNRPDWLDIPRDGLRDLLS